MKYGAKEAVPKEGMGLAMLVVGLILFVAGAAYGTGALQPLLELVGLVVFVASFVILRSARTSG